MSAANPSTAPVLPMLRRLWPFSAGARGLLYVGLSMIPLLAATTAARPLLLERAVDKHLAISDLPGLHRVAMMFFAVLIAEFLATGIQTYGLQRAGHVTIAKFRSRIFEHVLRLPMRFYDKNPIGALLSRTTSDVEALSETLSFGVFTIITDAVKVVVILAAMLMLDLRLTLISLSIAPFLFLIVRVFASVLRRLQLEIRKAMSIRSGFLAEQLAGITVVQLFGHEDAAHREYEDLGGRYLSATKRANVFDALLYSIMDGTAGFSIAMLFWFAIPVEHLGVAASHPVVGAGLLWAFIEYLRQIFIPIREFSGKIATIQRAAASLERVFGLLDEEIERQPEARDARALEGWNGKVVVDDLRFAYGAHGGDVLNGLNFHINEGEVVAVVGRTGSGKSSLGRVLTSLYDGYRGSILLTGSDAEVELRDVAPATLRSSILMVPQDVFLFDEDVGFNAALGATEADEAAVLGALDTVQIREAIDARGGLSLRVGERGAQLSVGERQLVAFARVALRRPKLLILDEATANVDSETEQKVQAAIERLFEGQTVLVVAHRLSTIRHADRILVMDEGKIVESGSHGDLMELDGVYAELIRHGLREEEL